MARTPATDAMLTIAPPPLSSIAGIWCFIPRNVPRTLVRMPRSNSSGSMSASGAGIGPSVALLNAASRRPKASTASATSARIESSSPTSVAAATARPPAASISPATSRQRSRVTGAEHHGVTGGGERLGGVGPDASAGTGDESNLCAVPWMRLDISASLRPPR